MENVVFSVPCPYGQGTIEVYLPNDSESTEWRIINADGVCRLDTALDCGGSGRGYGDASIALRDALMVSSGYDDPNRLS